MAGLRTVRVQSFTALPPSGLCARILCDERTRLGAVQVHRFLFAEGRTGHSLERSGSSHLVAGNRSAVVDQRPRLRHPRGKRGSTASVSAIERLIPWGALGYLIALQEAWAVPNPSFRSRS